MRFSFHRFWVVSLHEHFSGFHKNGEEKSELFPGIPAKPGKSCSRDTAHPYNRPKNLSPWKPNYDKTTHNSEFYGTATGEQNLEIQNKSFDKDASGDSDCSAGIKQFYSQERNNSEDIVQGEGVSVKVEEATDEELEITGVEMGSLSSADWESQALNNEETDQNYPGIWTYKYSHIICLNHSS